MGELHDKYMPKELQDKLVKFQKVIPVWRVTWHWDKILCRRSAFTKQSEYYNSYYGITIFPNTDEGKRNGVEMARLARRIKAMSEIELKEHLSKIPTGDIQQPEKKQAPILQHIEKSINERRAAQSFRGANGLGSREINPTTPAQFYKEFLQLIESDIDATKRGLAKLMHLAGETRELLEMESKTWNQSK